MKKQNFLLLILCTLFSFFYCSVYAQQKKSANLGQWIKVKDDANTETVNGFKGFKEKAEVENANAALIHSKTRWYRLMQKPNANYFEVLKEYNSYFAKHPPTESKPREFAQSWLKTKLYYLDRKGRVQAHAANYNKIPFAPPVGPATVTDSVIGSWRMIGPRYVIEPDDGSFSDNNGGYVTIVRMDPANTNKLFAGFQLGGLWVSANNGVSWRLADANLPAKIYYDIDICKANTSIVYAISENAVIKSIDGGFSWNITGLNSTNFTSGRGYDIAVSPTNADVVLARWGTSIYRSVNGGGTWTAVRTGLKDYSAWEGINGYVLEWDNNNNNNVFFTDRNDNQNYVDLYKSVDGGVSFSLLKSLTLPASPTGNVTGWSKIFTATNDVSSLFVMVGSGGDAYGHRTVHMFKVAVSNGNITLTRANMIPGVDNSYGSTTFLHHGDITMDINNSNTIVYSGYSNRTIQYSTNNGASFSVSSGTVHADIRSVFAIGGKILVGTDGGVSLSAGGAGGAYNPISQSISNHELWGFGSAFKSDLLVAGCNHGPLAIQDYAQRGGWYSVLGADQGNSDINPLDSVTIYSSGYDAYHVVRTGIKSFITKTTELNPGGIYEYFNQLEFHPNIYTTLITHHAGAKPVGNPNLETWKKSLIRSTDNGLTVQVIYTFPDVLFREKICMTNPNVIYAVVGLANNSLYKSTNGGTSWTNITPPASVTTAGVRNISDIAVSDANPNEIWVSYSGVQTACKVLRSSNGGTSYANITTTSLTTSPITKMIFQRGTNGGVYVGNTSGIYYRNNVLANWVKLGSGLPQMDVRFMFINYNKAKLLIGTSRGAWDHNLYETSATRAQISASTDKPSKCPYSVVKFRDYSVVRNASATWSWSFPGGTPSTSTLESPVVSYQNAAAGSSHNVTLTVTDANGSNTQTLTNFIKVQASANCSPIVSGRTYKLLSAVNNTSVLDVTGGNPADLTPVQLWNDNGGAAQKWKIIDVGNGYYQLQPLVNLNSALDVSYAATAEGSQVGIYSANGGTSQRWKLTSAGGGYYYLSPENAPGSNLDVNGGFTADGTKVQIWTANGGNAQKWKLVDVEAPVISGNIYKLVSAVNNSSVLDVWNGLPDPNTKVQLFEDNGSNAQKWKVNDMGDGYYQLLSLTNLNNALDVFNCGSANGTQVQVYTSLNNPCQRWKITSTGDGYFTLSPETAPGSSLDVNGGFTADGTKVQLWSTNGGNAQKWKFVNLGTGTLARRADEIALNSKLEDDETKDVRLVPNPAVNDVSIFVNAKKNQLAFLQVADANGKVILYRRQNLVNGATKISLDVSSMANGVYYVVVRINERTVTKKLVVQK